MSVLDEASKLIETRLGEIDGETKRLEKALAELGSNNSRKRPGRPRGSGASKPRATSGAQAQKRRRRKRKGGTRIDQALKLINDQPGINASDIAKKMKIKPNYLYRVLGDLEKEGSVKKDGRQYFPIEGAKAQGATA